jgi:hypothetical protein
MDGANNGLPRFKWCWQYIVKSLDLARLAVEQTAGAKAKPVGWSRCSGERRLSCPVPSGPTIAVAKTGLDTAGPEPG